VNSTYTGETTAMADDRGVVVDDNDYDESKIVTKFLLVTCLLRQPSIHQVIAVQRSSMLMSDRAASCTETGDLIHFIPLITGSSAEFLIQPMLSFVGDVDIMHHFSNVLAIPAGYPRPTDLPAEFGSHVMVCEIIDSEYPGYVYLMSSYLLAEDIYTGKYNATHTNKVDFYIIRPVLPHSEIHGPAASAPTLEANLTIEYVACVRCMSWPLQAADWPTRHRNHDWPDSATVDHVVNDGCDVVQVAHPLCRQDEWMSKRQWRLSFSRAEIVLLNSWMPVQQIVYHMLRVFAKFECLTNITHSIKTNIISNYHLKTLMMWASEKKSHSWWIDDINVVSTCVRLLHILGDWLEHQNCPHYFINNCNLVYNTEHVEIISQLVSITESWLSTWFVNNYLHKCAQLCPDKLLQLFDDHTSTELQNIVSAVIVWKEWGGLIDCWRVFIEAEYCVPRNLSEYSLTVRSYNFWINQLMKIDGCVHNYFNAVAFLHISKRIAEHSFNDELLDVLATAVGHLVRKRRYCHQLSSELSLSQAVILMRGIANNLCNTVQQIEFELSKAYLYRALRSKDSDSDSIYCLANVYLAVLYYTIGQYQ